MRGFLSLLAIFSVSSASNLRFLSLPQSIKLPAPNVASQLDSHSIAILNANLLGLSTKTPQGFSAETSLFSRPRALAVVQVNGFELPAEGDKYAIANDANTADTSIDTALSVAFGADRESVDVSSNGIIGTKIAQAAIQQKVDSSLIKSKLSVLRKELENVYALASAIKTSGAKFNKDSADIYRIIINGLSGIDLTADEKNTAISDINAALKQLTTALGTVYGEQVVLEVFSLTSNSSQQAINEPHLIRKRDADNSKKDPVQAAREYYNVSVMVSTDYPAIFAIFAGLVIALTLTVLYTTVGMMTMDPGKDSIIYRMTTTRMKKD